MKKYLLYLLPFIFLLYFIITPSFAQAAYDPGMVISDEEFTAKNSMSESQIQYFLEQKGSFLASYVVPAARTTTYYISSTKTLTSYEGTWIGPVGAEVNSEGWRASRVIYNVSQWYGINPQALITIIEKESSFITRADGSIAVPGHNSYATYAWLLGYGYTEDTTNPAKNVCGTATNNNPTGSCAGLAMQIDWAGGSLPGWANNAINHTSNYYSCSYWSGYYWKTDQTRWGVDSSFRLCDGDWVTARSGATAALYRYTPHTGLTGGYSGNKSFYLIFNSWFGGGLEISKFYLSDLRPAAGMTISGSYDITNNKSFDVTLDSVGLAGRLNAWDSGIVRDFGWQTGITIKAGETKSFYFSTPVYDVGKVTVWPCFKYSGIYYDKWKGWTDINSHFPNLTVNNALWVSPPPSMVGQESYYEITVKNHESAPILFGALGILVRGASGYSYDPIWRYGATISANGGQLTISGKSTITQPGIYLASAGAGFAGSYMTIPFSAGGNNLSYNVTPVTANFTFSSFWLSNLSPARGELLQGSFSVSNNTPVKQSLNGVGMVARPGSVSTGPNRDLGWYADVIFEPWQTKSFEFSSVVRDVSPIFVWPSFNYRGLFSHYYPGWTVANSHQAKLTSLTNPAVSFDPYYLYAGVNFTSSISIRNDEGKKIYLDGIGIAARDYLGRNADLGWTGPMQLNPGETYSLPLIRKISGSGMHVFWGATYLWPYYEQITPVTYKPIN